MNAELYILRNMNKAGMSNNEINSIASALKAKDINIVYKTELDSDEDKIVESVAQSIKPEENINYVIIPNSYSLKAVNTVIYKTLSFMVSSGDNRVKKSLLRNLGKLSGECVGATPVSGNGIKSGYYFVIGGVKFIVLPFVEKSGIKNLISNAIDAADNFKLSKKEVSPVAPLPDVKDINKGTSNKKFASGSLSRDELDELFGKKENDKLEVGQENIIEDANEIVKDILDGKLDNEYDNSNDKEEEINNNKEEKSDFSDGFVLKVDNDDEDISKVNSQNKDIDDEESIDISPINLKTYSHDVISATEKPKSLKKNTSNNSDKDSENTVNLGGNKKEKRKTNFFTERFISLKDDSKKEKARKVILDLAIIVFVVTACIIVKVMIIDSAVNSAKYDELRKQVKVDGEIATEITTDEQGNTIVKNVGTKTNWKDLKAINSEVVGWVNINDTAIDYPVLQHKGDNDDSQFYLYRDIYKNYSGYGSIFADYRSNKGAKSKNVILHGHHMRDGSMFENLMGYGKYSADMDFYKKHPTIDFDTPDGDASYKIISVFKTSTLDAHGDFFNYLVGSFNSDAEFMNYVYLVRERSLIDTGVTCNEDDQLLTLSTCSYEYSEFRTVVVARKTRAGETSKVDTSKAKANPNPLWPDVYYGYNDSAKPNVTSFKQANKKNQTDWYDGKGNLKGKERSFMLHEGIEEGATEATTKDKVNNEVVTEAPTEAPTVPQETEPQNVENQSILFDYSTLVMNVGDTETLKIYWTPENTSNKAVEWTSSNGRIATIASGGKVTAKSPGECTITAKTSNGNTTSCKIVVNDIVAEGITISPSNHTTNNVNETFTIKAVVTPSNHSHSVSWSSSNTNVATVNGGTVRVRGYGSCVITASIDGMTVSCNVTVNQPATNPPAPTNPPATNPPAPTDAPTTEENE